MNQYTNIGLQNNAGFLAQGFLIFGPNNQQKEVPIVLDINRPITSQEYVVGGGIHNSLEKKLEQYSIQKCQVTKENKFSLIAIEQLIKILNDSTLIDHHTTILREIRIIVSQIGQESGQFLPLIIPSILSGISMEGETNIHYISAFHDCLKTIIDCVPQQIVQYQDMIFDTIEKVLTQQQSQHISEIITLIRHINTRNTQSYLPQMNFILPKILQIIESKSNNDLKRMGMSQGKHVTSKSQLEDLKICKEALQIIQKLKRVTQDDNLHLIIPLLVRVISRSNNNEQREEIEYKIEIVHTLHSLV